MSMYQAPDYVFHIDSFLFDAIHINYIGSSDDGNDTECLQIYFTDRLNIRYSFQVFTWSTSTHTNLRFQLYNHSTGSVIWSI